MSHAFSIKIDLCAKVMHIKPEVALPRSKYKAPSAHRSVLELKLGRNLIRMPALNVFFSSKAIWNTTTDYPTEPK